MQALSGMCCICWLYVRYVFAQNYHSFALVVIAGNIRAIAHATGWHASAYQMTKSGINRFVI